MTRILLAVLLAALATACSNAGSTDAGDSEREPDAEAVKTEVDAEAAVVLPDLMAAVGGTLGGMQATFSERGGFGVWDYTASGTVYGLPGTAGQALAAGTDSLKDHGFTVEADAEKESVRATKGNVRLTLGSAFPDDEKGVASLNVTFGSADAVSDGDDFADSAPPEDYLSLLDPDQVSR